MNRRFRVLLAVAMAIAWLPSAGAGPVFDAIKARRDGAQQPVGGESAEVFDGHGTKLGRGTLPPGARLEQDLTYGVDLAQKVDVYIPKGADNAPIILMVHGGAWMIGDKANSGVVANKVTNWLPKGYIVASTNYRMSRAPNPLDQADDVARALAFVQSSAPAWGGDPSRIVLMGHSSGAHLVALLAADPGIATARGARPWLGTVALDSAALNVVETMSLKHLRFYDRVFGSDRAHWAETSPFHRLAGPLGPTLLVCSSERGDSCPAANAFAAKAKAMGGHATVLPIDLNHGAINSELGRASAYTRSVEAFVRSLGLP